MGNQKTTAVTAPDKRASFLVEIFKQVKLVWLLLQDRRVGLALKAIIPLSLLYTISPIDFLPDVFLGLGQLDDLGIILLGMTLFVKLCPPDLVEYYRRQIDQGDAGSNERIIDAPYRPIDEE